MQADRQFDTNHKLILARRLNVSNMYIYRYFATLDGIRAA